jgi:hypothetical protein
MNEEAKDDLKINQSTSQLDDELSDSYGEDVRD